MLVDPWGEVCAVLPEGEGVVAGEIDPAHLRRVRESLPELKHRKL
jgi:nitrilase